MLRSTLWILAVLLFARVAGAQVQNHVSPYKVGVGGWVLNPIVQTGQSGCAVHSFLALSKADATFGSNIVAVWYQRDGTGWATKSWHTTDQAEAIKYVKQELSIPDADDELWDEGISTAVLAEKAPSMPENYLKGLLASDPLAQVLADPLQREFVVEILTQAGYQSADVPLDKNAIGDASTGILDQFASEVETIHCTSGGVQATQAFKANVLGVGSLNLSSAFFSAIPPCVPWEVSLVRGLRLFRDSPGVRLGEGQLQPHWGRILSVSAPRMSGTGQDRRVHRRSVRAPLLGVLPCAVL